MSQINKILIVAFVEMLLFTNVSAIAAQKLTKAQKAEKEKQEAIKAETENPEKYL